MQKRVFSVLAIVLAVFAVSCGSDPATAAVSDPSVPPWINEQPPEDLIWGIGVAESSTLNMRMTMSESRARQDIARQLQTLAQGMITDYTREAGGVNNTAVVQFQESVSRQLTQATLQGATRDLTWTSPDSKTLWTRLKMNKADAAKSVADSTQKAIDSEAARYAEFKAMDALKMMDMQLQKTSTSPQPVMN